MENKQQKSYSNAINNLLDKTKGYDHSVIVYKSAGHGMSESISPHLIKNKSCDTTEIIVEKYRDSGITTLNCGEPRLFKRVSTEELQQSRIKSYKYML
jgi:hypothetical protein